MFDEETLEKVTMEMLQNLDYECINGYEMQRTDFSKVLLEEDLVQAIEKINKGIKEEQVLEAIRLIRNLDHNNTVLNNKQFTKYLLEGIPVPVQENGETRYKTIKIVDFDTIKNNTFKAINQYTIIEHSEIYNFFLKYKSYYASDKYFSDFLSGLYKHTLKVNNELFEEMRRKFSARILEITQN